MNYTNIYDMHTHSQLSFDGNDACERLCDSAIDKGAKGIAITDHCDIDGKDDYDAFCREQFEITSKIKDKYNGKLEVLQGLEIGQGIYRKEHTEKILKSFDYDFILGSLHNLENTEDFYFLKYDEGNLHTLLQRYFEDILKLCCWGAFDSLAHLTYPLRYITGRDGIKVDLAEYHDIIDMIFIMLINGSKALEINASTLFNPLGETMPCEELIKRYKSLGGKYITVGSDSHYAKWVTRGVLQAYELAQKCGFNQVTVFRKREPVLINIE